MHTPNLDTQNCDKRSNKRLDVDEQIEELTEHFDDILEHQSTYNSVPKDSEKHWDLASSILDLVEIQRNEGKFSNAFVQLDQLGEIFKKFTNWNTIGIGRAAIDEAFKLSISADNKKQARKAFTIAENWLKEYKVMPLESLELALEAAENAKLLLKKLRYKYLLKKENHRINQTFYTSK